MPFVLAAGCVCLEPSARWIVGRVPPSDGVWLAAIAVGVRLAAWFAAAARGSRVAG